MEMMKTLIENPQGSLVAGCIIIFLTIIVVAFVIVVLSSFGYNIGNMSVWTTVFFSALSFVIGLLTGGNLKEKHN